MPHAQAGPRPNLRLHTESVATPVLLQLGDEVIDALYRLAIVDILVTKLTRSAVLWTAWSSVRRALIIMPSSGVNSLRQ